MNVLITGGAGFIGSHTVDLLLTKGYSVKVLDNFSSGKRSNLSKSNMLEIVNGDVCDYDCVKYAMAGITHVLHLAAQVSAQASIADPLKSNSINITGFLNVLHASMNAQISRFVYASSAAVYGVADNLPLTEFSPIKPISIYGVEKATNEEYARIYNNLYDLSVLGLRYSNVYGQRQDNLSPYTGVISKFIKNIKAKESLTIYGDGSQTRDFIHVKNISMVNFLSLKGDAEGICNVGTGNTLSIKEIVDTFVKMCKFCPKIVFAPSIPGDIKYSSMDITKMKSLFGIIEPPEFKKAIREILNAS